MIDNLKILKKVIPQKNRILKEIFSESGYKAEDISLLDTKLMPLLNELINITKEETREELRKIANNSINDKDILLIIEMLLKEI